MSATRERRVYENLSSTVDVDGWSEWQRPRMEGYRTSCCDCGLVHVMRFHVDDDGDVFVQFKRDNRATGQVRRYRKGWRS